MKHQIKKILTTSIFLALTSTVYAGVETDYSGRKFSIYGNIDAGLVSVSNMGTSNSRANMFLNSPNLTSRIGFKGSESISDELTVGFRLEHMIMPGDGTNGVASSSTASNAMFNLNSHLFAETKSYGSLYVGRQNSITYNAQRDTDTRGGRNFGGSLSFWTDNVSFGGTATSKSGLLSLNGGNQISNAIRYDLPTWNGFTLQGMYVPGGVAGDDDASSKKAFALTYKGIDDLTLVASQIELNNTLGQEVGRTRVLGGNYKFFDKKATVAIGYITMENPYLQGAANTDFTLVTVTGKYEFAKDFNIAGGWYKLSDEINNSNSARQLSVTATYNLSKNTEIYAGWAQMANEGNFGLAPLAQGHLGLNSLSTAYPSKIMNPGQTHDAIMAGMMIRF